MNAKTIKKCIAAYNAIESEKELRRDKITQAQHFEIGYTISEAVQTYNTGKEHKGETISEAVKNWFMKHGAKAVPHGIGWYIYF